MDELNKLLKTIRGVSRTNPVTNMQLSEIIRKLWRNYSTGPTRVYRAVPLGDIDGVNCFFDLPAQVIVDTEEVFLNGVLQNTNAYTISEELNPTRIIFIEAPKSDDFQTDSVLVNYSY